ncbi:MAG: MBL fold metallo-hydrolase [Myxococcota bacterium]
MAEQRERVEPRSRRVVASRVCWALGMALVAAMAFGSALGSASTPPDASSLGPAPIDEDGLFTNWIGDLPHGTLSTRVPFFVRRVLGSFVDRPGAPTLVENDGASLRDAHGSNAATVTWVGHATLLVQMDGVTFLTDPTWSETASPVSFAGPRRFVPPGLAMDDLPKIDFVVVSHNHYDHLDLATLAALAERDPDTVFLVPLANAELLRENGVDRVVELDWGQARDVGGVRVYALPAQHWSKRGLGDDREALWASWGVVGPTRRFYFSGDTGFFDGFSKIGEVLGPFDLAAVPIGAYEPREMMRWSHTNPEEAVQAAVDVRAKRAVAIHFGTFDLSDEPLDEPPRRFKAAAAETPLGDEGSWVLSIGETRPF